mmetsp:Transcript_79558/g.233913  ORF Transcript_79558/g.233913 Transcript_79558/m.233913 type:complete len:665 (+) Transcript_79558:58-2052(+)
MAPAATQRVTRRAFKRGVLAGLRPPTRVTAVAVAALWGLRRTYTFGSVAFGGAWHNCFAAVQPSHCSPSGARMPHNVLRHPCRHLALHAAAAPRVGFATDAYRGSGGSASVQDLVEEAPQDLHAFEDLPTALWLQGRVRHKASYGIWVDVESPDSSGGPPAVGLVHLTEVADHDAAWSQISPGTEMRVRVVHVDKERGRLSLSSLGEEASDLLPPEQLKSAFGAVFSCEWLRGLVRSVADDGVLVDVVPPRGGLPGRGLCPAARIGVRAGTDLAQHFRPGQDVHVRVVGVVPTSGQGLELSMLGGAEEIKADLEAQLQARQQEASRNREPRAGSAARPVAVSAAEALPDWQDLSCMAGISQAQVLEGAVHHVSSYGVYVTVPLPGGHDVWGLVHLTQLGGSAGEDNHAGVLSYSPGDQVRVRIAHLDLEQGRLALAMQSHLGDNSVQGSAGQEAHASVLESLPATAWLGGVIQSVLEYGIIVDVLLPGTQGNSVHPGSSRVPGLVYITELDRFTENPAEEFAVGQEVQVRVLDAAGDPDGLLMLSMRSDPADVQADLEHQEGLALAVPDPLSAAATTEEVPTQSGKSLVSFLDVSPSRPLRGVAHSLTPFGLLVSVEHPDNGDAAHGLISEQSLGNVDWSPGQELDVFIATVDSHRGVLGLSPG